MVCNAQLHVEYARIHETMCEVFQHEVLTGSVLIQYVFFTWFQCECSVILWHQLLELSVFLKALIELFLSRMSMLEHLPWKVLGEHKRCGTCHCFLEGR